MPYQSFGKRGSSNSAGKWDALSLDEQLLKGKRVLDLGCNMGFFCFKCVELGASEVVGIDRSMKSIQSAKKHAANHKIGNVEFQCMNWDSLDSFPNDSFDVVLILSAMHYSSSPEDILPDGSNKVMNQIQRILKDDGLFVYEGGVVMKETDAWHRLNRGMDVVYYPTKTRFERTAGALFKEVKYVGKSVKQRGDPISRHVYHCRK